jgi:hypothetical protein
VPVLVLALPALLVLVTAVACETDEPISGAPSPEQTEAQEPVPDATAGAAPAPDAELPAEHRTAPHPREPAPGPARLCEEPIGCYDDPVRAGTFDAEAVPGASGLAASRRNPGLLYLLDDRPGTQEVWVLGTDGDLRGAVTVEGLDALDTESLAVGPCGPDEATPCVFVGDIGDNLRSRTDIVVHRFPEPDLTGELPEAVAAEAARWTYPDGPHDAEALLVDEAGTVLIVTKAPFDPEAAVTGDARLYRAPAFADGVLEHLGVLPVPEPQEPLHSVLVGNVVTGGDYRAGRVLLRTYDQVLEYVAPDGAGLDMLAEWTVREVPGAFEPQSEAITWAADGCGYLTVSEMVGEIWFTPCLP